MRVMLRSRMISLCFVLTIGALSVFAHDVSAQFRQSTLVTLPLMPRTRVESGVKVLEHDRSAFEHATQLELTGPPITVVGGATGDVKFDLTGVNSAALLSDGRIATLSPIGSRFFVFAANGKALRTVGRQGNGPGEFMAPDDIVLLGGDTMFVADPSNTRLNWVTADHGVVRSKQRAKDRQSLTLDVAGVFRDGSLLVSSSWSPGDDKKEVSKRSALTISVLRTDSEMKELAKLANYDQSAIEVDFGRGRYMQTVVHGYTRTALAKVWNNNVVTGVGDSFRFETRSRDGAILSTVSVATPRIAVTKPMRDAFIERQLPRFRGAQSERMINRGESERIVRSTPFADSLPPYVFFYISPNNTLWVVDGHSLIDTEWHATAFRADGAIVGRLRMAGKGIPMAFGDDRVVIRDEDEDGVVSLSVRKIGVVKRK